MTGNKRSLSDSDVPQWIQQAQKFCQNNMSSIKVKLLCGGDLLESFGTPGLWKDCDVSNQNIFFFNKRENTDKKL